MPHEKYVFDTEMLFAPYSLLELGSSLENTAGIIK